MYNVWETHDCVGESRASEGANLLVAVSTLGSGEASKQWIGRRTQKRPRKVEAPKKGRPTKSARVFLISFGSLSSWKQPPVVVSIGFDADFRNMQVLVIWRFSWSLCSCFGIVPLARRHFYNCFFRFRVGNNWLYIGVGWNLTYFRGWTSWNLPSIGKCD